MVILEKIKPLTEKQKLFINALANDKIHLVGAFGPSGTGKSFIASIFSIDMLLIEKYEKFIVFKPIVDVKTGKEYTIAELGEIYNKVALDYLYDITSSVIPRNELNKLINEDRLIIADPHFLRGRTFDNSIILLDDAQLVSFETLTEVLMRIGQNSKLIIAGDPVLQRVDSGEKDGATLARELLIGEEKSVVVDFGLKDVVRFGARRGIKLALELRMRRRALSEIEQKILETSYLHAPDADIVTVVYVKDEKEKYKLENVPDALIISKEDYLGRLVGRNGERIRAIEKDTELSLRAIELTLDLKPLITSLHPIGWIGKHIVDVDFAGPDLVVTVNFENYGAFLGAKGAHIRLIDSVMRKLLDVGVKVRQLQRTKEARGRRR